MAEGEHPDRAAIQAGQLAKLRELLATLIPANPFYTKKFQATRTAANVASLEDFCARFPFTSKSELVADQETHPLFGTNLTFPLEHYTRFHQTSGTTGLPLRWLDTPESWSGMVKSWVKVFRAAGIGAPDKIYFAFSFGPFIGFWLAFDAGQKIGALCVPGGGLSSEARLKAILENEITVLCCTPTYALRLAEVAAREKIDLRKSRVRKLIVAGEPGGSIPVTRERLEKLWPGANVFDHHGMTEVGPVTYECPAQPGILHVIESDYLAEIVHPQTGKKIPSGETGELVLTTLGRAGSPLLRYRTGDLICAAENSPCACGRSDLALRGGILGRVDDMIIVRGVNIHPSGVEKILLQFDDLAEYRATVTTQNSMAELSLEIEPTPDCQNIPELEERIGKKLQATFNLRIAVCAVPPKTLPRFEMKAKRWIQT